MRVSLLNVGVLYISVLCIVFGASPVQAEVFRCVAIGEPVTFSDLPCKNAPELVELSPGNTMANIPLSSDEQTALNRFENRWQAAQAQRKRQRQQQRHQREKNRTEQRTLCTSARNALADLHAERRKGYAVSRAQHLQSTERDLRRKIIDHC